jgi:hypothetical protein
MPSFSDPPKRSTILGLGFPIAIDAVLSESHESTKEFTQYPTESFLANDNAYSLPEKLELKILVTDTPTDGSPVFAGRHRAIYSQLRLWQELASPVIVSTGLRSYAPVYIERLNAVKTPQDGKSIILNINFTQIIQSELSLALLVANLLVSSDIAYTATEKVDIGVI